MLVSGGTERLYGCGKAISNEFTNKGFKKLLQKTHNPSRSPSIAEHDFHSESTSTLNGHDLLLGLTVVQCIVEQSRYSLW